MVKCLLCSQEFEMVTSSHLVFRHGVTLPQYLAMFPNCETMSQEMRNRIAQTLTGRKQSSETIAKRTQSEMGREVTQQTRRKIALKLMGHPVTKEARTKMPVSHKGLTTWLGRKHTPETRKKMSLTRTGQPQSEARKKHQSEVYKRLWANPEFARCKIQSFHLHPNKPEMKLSYILRHLCPHNFRYNGDCRLGTVLNRRIPDFVNVNGRKQVIELFGDYWHSEQKREIPEAKGVDGTIKAYKDIGWDCLIIWERELKDKDEVRHKIRNFVAQEVENH